MYKVLYRKYRPRFFADVIGQPQVTTTLKNELMLGRISHAYLFTGSRGTGKTTCAQILSRAVNCLHTNEGDPCGECEVCQGLENGSILDVVEIDAASNNGIDSIRALIEESNFTPTTTKYRVYIIDEVHMLSVSAFNALLKTLEEPPAHVIFILATTEVHKLLPTILSRCQRFDFKRISPEHIADRLSSVTMQEGAEIDRDAALLIARIADGAMRDALSLLDQCLGRSSKVTIETVNETAGIAGREYLCSLAQSIVDGDIGGAISTINELYNASKDMSRLCAEMAEYFRNLMLVKTMRDATDVVSASENEMERMLKQALSMNLSVIIHSLDTFEGALNKMRFANQRTELEIAIVRLCSPELDSTPEALIRRIEALEVSGVRTVHAVNEPKKVAEKIETAEQKPEPKVVLSEKPQVSSVTELPIENEQSKEDFSVNAPQTSSTGGEIEFEEKNISSPSFEEEIPLPKEPIEETYQMEEPVQVSESIAPPNPKPISAENGKTAPMSIAELSNSAERFMDWPEILQVIKKYSASIAAAFGGSSAYISGEFMLIQAPQLAFDLLKRPSQRDMMRSAVKQITGRTYKLGPYKPGDEEKTADPLDDFMQRASQAGIPVEEKSEETEAQLDGQQSL